LSLGPGSCSFPFLQDRHLPFSIAPWAGVDSHEYARHVSLSLPHSFAWGTFSKRYEAEDNSGHDGEQDPSQKEGHPETGGAGVGHSGMHSRWLSYGESTRPYQLGRQERDP
jgi:hypothetical protein